MSAEYIQSENLLSDGITHGFFSRNGGVSSGIYSTLNAGFGSKDLAHNISHNRALIAKRLACPNSPVLTPYQSHSNIAYIARKPWQHQHAPKADALVTKERGMIIGILTADCTPILFADKQNGIIGAAHAGWRGALGGIIEATLEAMVSLGSAFHEIDVAIGPTIRQKNYEVGEEFKVNFLQQSLENETFFITHPETGRPHFNLPQFCIHRLHKAKVRTIHDVKQCTYKNESIFFSFRRNCHKNKQDYGRQMSAIAKI